MFVRSLVVLFVAMVVLAGCSAWPPFTARVGSGHPVAQTFEFTDFDSLDIDNAFQAEIAAADSYRVEVTADDNLVDLLQVEQQGTTVRIGLRPNTSVSSSHLQARITLPALARLDISGAARADVTGFDSDRPLHIGASGASTVQGELTSGDLTVDVSGGSTLRLAGSGATLRANVSGAATADLSDFAVDDASVDANGASRVEVNASGTLDARANGASTVHYTGNPTLGSVDESGGSTVSGQ